jgi:hypothetical protein
MPDDVTASIRNLLARLAQEQRRSAERTGRSLHPPADGKVDLSAVCQELLAFTRESAGEYVRSVLSLHQEYNRARNDLSRVYLDRLTNRLLTAAGTTSVPGQQVEVALTGPIGAEVSAPFLIKNDQVQPEEITFIVSEFSDLRGQAPFRPPLRVDPPHLLLQPGAQAVVTLHLQLVSQLFEPGTLYRATVTVQGRDLELVLHALAYPPTPAAAASTSPAGARPATVAEQPRRRRTKPTSARTRAPRSEDGRSHNAG